MKTKKLLILIIIIIMISGCKRKEIYIKNNDNLYEEAISYLIEHDTNPDRVKDRYKIFTEYKGFGISKDEKYRYVYLWILEESYFIEDNKIISGSGSSMPYKFIFKLEEDKVVEYETPKDGNKYVSSIKKMYPNDIEDKAIHYEMKNDIIIKEVKNYYSDLKDKSIYYYTGEKYIKLDK